MDKETLRIVIIAAGLIIIIAMLTWSYLKDQKNRRDMGFYDARDDDNDSDYDNDDKKTVTDVEPVPIATAYTLKSDRYNIQPDGEHEDDDYDPPPRPIAPAIIQFCIAAKTAEGFNGVDLIYAFKIARLEYGSLKVFERLDSNRLVDFGVACTTAPGTFPGTHLESFYTPGLVFFMQPGALDDPLSVFEDYIETIKMLAVILDGELLDHEGEPLTDATIQSIRQSL